MIDFDAINKGRQFGCEACFGERDRKLLMLLPVSLDRFHGLAAELCRLGQFGAIGVVLVLRNGDGRKHAEDCNPEKSRDCDRGAPADCTPIEVPGRLSPEPGDEFSAVGPLAFVLHTDGIVGDPVPMEWTRRVRIRVEAPDLDLGVTGPGSLCRVPAG